jgi:hypothetical protein
LPQTPANQKAVNQDILDSMLKLGINLLTYEQEADLRAGREAFAKIREAHPATISPELLKKFRNTAN